MAVNTARVQKLRKRQIDGQSLKRLVEAGMTWLRTNQQIVNALNVFPVPDGDTGTNMLLTLTSAYNEVKDSGEKHLGKMAGLVAKGALMGARGNSGVILSQLWRGFARAVQDHETLDAETLVKAFAESRDTAYKGVVRPVEGTILTVSKGIARRYSHPHLLWLGLAAYALAKLCETLDAEIFAASAGLVSGHTLKHLVAAVGLGCLARMLVVRR